MLCTKFEEHTFNTRTRLECRLLRKNNVESELHHAELLLVLLCMPWRTYVDSLSVSLPFGAVADTGIYDVLLKTACPTNVAFSRVLHAVPVAHSLPRRAFRSFSVPYR